MVKNGLFTNEIVFRGHPDQIMGQIANTILQYLLKEDIDSRVGIDGCGGKGIIFLTGEVSTKAKFNDEIVEKLTKQAMLNAGMLKEEVDTYKVINNIGKQSSDIALGVDKKGAGDQGIVYGYAEINESEYDVPVAMVILQEFSREYDSLVKMQGAYKGCFKADGKAQITGLYKDNELISIEKFVVAYQNNEKQREITDIIIKDLIYSTIYKVTGGKKLQVKEIVINATGKFEIGGFTADAGEIGRKIVVQQTQGFSRVGGGCTEGKDPTKVDFSAVFIAREIAKKYLLEFSDAMAVEVQLAYVIGKQEPVSINITMYGIEEVMWHEKNYIYKTINGNEDDYKFASVPNCIKKGQELINKLVDLASFGLYQYKI